mgnify:CR=1 FL=1
MLLILGSCFHIFTVLSQLPVASKGRCVYLSMLASPARSSALVIGAHDTELTPWSWVLNLNGLSHPSSPINIVISYCPTTTMMKVPFLESKDTNPSAHPAINFNPHSQGAQAMEFTEAWCSKVAASCHSFVLTSFQMITFFELENPAVMELTNYLFIKAAWCEDASMLWMCPSNSPDRSTMTKSAKFQRYFTEEQEKIRLSAPNLGNDVVLGNISFWNIENLKRAWEFFNLRRKVARYHQKSMLRTVFRSNHTESQA